MWNIWEIQDENDRTPVSDALTRHHQDPKFVLRKLRLLQALGWPEAAQSLEISNVGSDVYVLKCKPKDWRIYFSVLSDGALLLLAVQKKKWSSDPNDQPKAKRLLEDYRAKRATRRLVQLD